MRVGFLGSFDGVAQLVGGSLIFAVGEEDHGLAAGLAGEFIVGSLNDCVIKQSAARGAGGQRAGSHSTGADIDLCLLHVAGEHAGVGGEVGEQVDVDVEGDEKGLVLLAEDAFQKLRAGVLFKRQNVLLRA